MESHAPDGLAIIPFILATISGCILFLLQQQFALLKFLGGRKQQLGEAEDRKVRFAAALWSIMWLTFIRRELMSSISCISYPSKWFGSLYHLSFSHSLPTVSLRNNINHSVSSFVSFYSTWVFFIITYLWSHWLTPVRVGLHYGSLLRLTHCFYYLLEDPFHSTRFHSLFRRLYYLRVLFFTTTRLIFPGGNPKYCRELCWMGPFLAASNSGCADTVVHAQTLHSYCMSHFFPQITIDQSFAAFTRNPKSWANCILFLPRDVLVSRSSHSESIPRATFKARRFTASPRETHNRFCHQESVSSTFRCHAFVLIILILRIADRPYASRCQEEPYILAIVSVFSSVHAYFQFLAESLITSLVRYGLYPALLL